MVAFMMRSGSRQKMTRGGGAGGRSGRRPEKEEEERERTRQAKGGGGLNEIQIERGVESFARVNDLISRDMTRARRVHGTAVLSSLHDGA